MPKQIVKMHIDEPRAGTFLIAQGFERDHFKVMRLVEKYKERFLRLENNKRLSKSLIINKISVKTAGRPVEEYMLNEKQALFLGTLFRNSDIVLDFKERLANDFVELKDRVKSIKDHKTEPAYKLIRDAGKLVRRDTTDCMDDFIIYATEQGSKNAKMYYMNITRMMNGLLFIVQGKYKNLREVMSIPQLMTTSAAEQIINKGLKDGMKNKMFYKEIYQDVKSKVMQFAELHGKTEVIDDYLKLEQ